MSGIKRYLSDNAYKAAEHSESPGESNPFVTLSKAMAMRSDWNENDTTQYDYILNRTHYVDYIPTDYEAEEATFFEDGGYALGSIYGWSSGHSRYPEGFTEALAEGMPFKFIIGDTTYEGIAHRSGSVFYAGNRHIDNNVFPDTGESWCVSSEMFGMAPLDFYIDSSYIGTTQNIVPTTYSEVVHQLPTKFIKSDLATKQDALEFIPENVANKKTTLADNSDSYYPTQKAVKTAVDSLNSIINQIGANATYKGEAIPSTNPGTPDALVFYITSTQGTYANFGGFVLDGGFAVLSNVTGSWTGTKFLKTELDAKANQNELDQLANEINNTIFQTEDGEFSIEDVFGNKSLGITNDGKLFFSKITSETIAYLNSVINGGGVAFIDKIRNKKVAILGDSISTDTGGGNANLVYPQQYWGLLGQLQGCTIYRNAIGGTTITQGGQGTPFVNDARWQSLDSNFIPDVIIVFGGINDFLQDIPLGVSTDTVTTTFYGALDYLYRNLLSTYTSTRIFHMTPLHTTFYQAGGLIPEFNGINYLSEYIDAIYHVARRYGVSIIDTNRDSGISCFNIDLLSDDNIHVKAVGHEMIYNTIINYTNLSL